MRRNIRLIAIDIDGTLLDSNHQVSAKNAQAVAAAVERGIEVALVTGRRFDFALPVANQIPCPLTMIVNNGALIKTTEWKMSGRSRAAQAATEEPKSWPTTA